MMQVAARFIFACLFIFVFSFITAGSTFAQEITSTPLPEPPITTNTNPDVPQDLRSTVQIIFIEMLGSVSCQITGYNAMDAVHGNKCLGIDHTTGKYGYIEGNGGALATVAGGIIATYSIPVSSSQYIAYTADNFGLTRSAYAQYTGFQTLSPLLKIWKVFRDLVYLLFVVVFILIGLGIMFRFQIDARTVMTIQNQIPKVIIALLLVTFSYAIAGFLVDMMWVSIYLITAVMTNGTGVTGDIAKLTSPELLFKFPLFYGDHVLKGSPNSLSGTLDVAGNVGVGGQTILKDLFDMDNWKVPGLIRDACSLSNLDACVGTALGDIVAKFLSVLVQFFAWGAIFLIAAVTLLITFVRIWFALIRAYIYILLGVVFGPFWIISGLLPGNEGGVGPWLRDLLANLSAFPVVIVLFLLGKIFIDNFGQTPSATQFVPPFIGYPGNPNELAGIIGFAIVLITPEALNITREKFKAPDFKYMATVGKAVGAGQGMVGGFTGGVSKYLWKRDPYTGAAKGPLAVALGNSKNPYLQAISRLTRNDWSSKGGGGH
jgi:hypothetical protein